MGKTEMLYRELRKNLSLGPGPSDRFLEEKFGGFGEND
jgi:hypothetical protein